MQPIDRSLIGLASDPRTFEVTPEAIAEVAEAIGDPCPGYGEGIAPPTFPDRFKLMFPAAFPAFEEFDLALGLFGEQEYEYTRPLRAGDRVTCVARVVDVSEAETRLGPFTRVLVETEARDEAGELVFTGRATTLVR